MQPGLCRRMDVRHRRVPEGLLGSGPGLAQHPESQPLLAARGSGHCSCSGEPAPPAFFPEERS